jgi:hypothetical protein
MVGKGIEFVTLRIVLLLAKLRASSDYRDHREDHQDPNSFRSSASIWLEGSHWQPTQSPVRNRGANRTAANPKVFPGRIRPVYAAVVR